MQMHPIWRYIETLHLWKQLAILTGFFTLLGFSLRDISDTTSRGRLVETQEG
jgi:hypothetical protein